jgi:hypothetical protein
LWLALRALDRARVELDDALMSLFDTLRVSSDEEQKTFGRFYLRGGVTGDEYRAFLAGIRG